MHQTTVRFGKDLWQALEYEASAAGISVAQFVRESAVARLAQSAVQRAQASQEPLVAVAEVRSRAERADAAASHAPLVRQLGAPGRRTPQLLASDRRPPA